MADKPGKKTARSHAATVKAAVQEQVKGKPGISLRLKLVVFLGIVSFALYANSLKNGYALDDVTAITFNALVQKGISAVPELLHTPYHWGFKLITNDLYRPLSLVMFAVEYQFFGPNPAPGHMMNILLFAGCVVLLFLFLDALFEQKKTAAAFIAALLFALHPIHTEVVDNIKSRDELLCFFFAFLSLVMYLKYIKSGKPAQIITGSFCFFLSLLSKETAITFLAVIPLVFFFYQNENRKRSVFITLCAAGAAIVFLAIRFSVLSVYHANHFFENYFIKNELAQPGLPFESRIATAILMLGHYLRLLFVPYPLICDYSYNTIPFAHFSDPAVLLSLAAYLFLAFLGVKRILKNSKDPYAFGIFFFLVTISLFSNIPFLTGTTMGERLLFFPSVGFCMVAAFLIEMLAGRSVESVQAVLKTPKVLWIIFPVCIIYSGITINRNSDWQNDLTLFSADVKKAPGNCRLNFFIGDIMLNSLSTENDLTKLTKGVHDVIPYLTNSVVIYDGYATAHYDLGTSYFTLDQFDSAEIHYKKAIECDQTDINFFLQLGRVYFVEKKYQQSVDINKRALVLKPDFTTVIANIGFSYLNAGNYDSAICYLNKVAFAEPGFNGINEMLANAWKAKGDLDSARKYEANAHRSSP